jgi:methyl-accepting chemotaxis protein
MRNLAMRAAEAAKNTSDLIEDTVKKIKYGSDLVTTTNEAFTEVSASTSKVGELVGEIAASSKEQAQGIDQTNTAGAQMDKVTQQSAANAEESASASEEMTSQAEQMRGIVEELKTIVGGSKKEKRLAKSNEETEQKRGAGRRENSRGFLNSFSAHEGEKTRDKEVTVRKNDEVKPDEVILMNEGDFKDF